jgi:hypothetical protein
MPKHIAHIQLGINDDSYYQVEADSSDELYRELEEGRKRIEDVIRLGGEIIVTALQAAGKAKEVSS